MKKKSKVPNEEIEKAKSYRKNYLERLEKDKKIQ